MRIQTETVQFKADQKLLDHIERKLQKLERLSDRITNAIVYLKLENSGQVRDKIAEIRLHVPGQVLVAKSSSRTFESSVDDAVESLRRQLNKYKEKFRSGIS